MHNFKLIIKFTVFWWKFVKVDYIWNFLTLFSNDLRYLCQRMSNILKDDIILNVVGGASEASEAVYVLKRAARRPHAVDSERYKRGQKVSVPFWVYGDLEPDRKVERAKFFFEVVEHFTQMKLWVGWTHSGPANPTYRWGYT